MDWKKIARGTLYTGLVAASMSAADPSGSTEADMGDLRPIPEYMVGSLSTGVSRSSSS